MTSKEKAEELLIKYRKFLPMNLTTMLDSKRCALIAVDEIMEFMKMDDEYTETASNANSKWVNYWLQVNDEINKL